MKIIKHIRYVIAIISCCAGIVWDASGQVAVADTAGLYGERKDSLDAAVYVSRQSGNYLKKGSPIRTEVISSAGLHKMACCTLAESFENSASVTVGYSDAVTGARQIRLLGLSGVYTQMLDENRPVMRGLASPFGLSYVPGQWLESIQIAKGASSVINGVESMTGQINMEHRKPTDEKPLFLNASVMSDTKVDFNAASSLQMGFRTLQIEKRSEEVWALFSKIRHDMAKFNDEITQTQRALDGAVKKVDQIAKRSTQIGSRLESVSLPEEDFMPRADSSHIALEVLSEKDQQ